jgi:hypothetical protein
MVHQNARTNTGETVSATVEATIPKGIKVGGQWFNRSQLGTLLACPPGERRLKSQS